MGEEDLDKLFDEEFGEVEGEKPLDLNKIDAELESVLESKVGNLESVFSKAKNDLEINFSSEKVKEYSPLRIFFSRQEKGKDYCVKVASKDRVVKCSSEYLNEKDVVSLSEKIQDFLKSKNYECVIDVHELVS